MFRPGIAGCAMAALALAQGFTFTIGSPVAAQDFRSKTAAFAIRTEGCADPAASQIGGTAEGLVNGMRRSVTLRVAEMSKPGVYAVYQNLASGRRVGREPEGDLRGRERGRPGPDRRQGLCQRGVEILYASGHRGRD